MSAPTHSLKSAALPAMLTKIAGSADLFQSIDDELELCRAVVEFARNELGVERVSIHRFFEDGMLHGTYGTTDRGQTIEETSASYPVGELWLKLYLHSDGCPKYWIDRGAELSYIENGKAISSRVGWIGSTLIGHPPIPYGVMFHDSALSGNSHDPVIHEALSTLCAVIAEIFESRGIRRLQMLRFSDELEDPGEPIKPREFAKTSPPNSGLALVWIDDQQRIIEANSFARELIGSQETRLTGLPIDQVFSQSSHHSELLNLWNDRSPELTRRTTVSYMEHQLDMDWRVISNAPHTSGATWLLVGSDVTHHMDKVMDLHRRHMHTYGQYAIRAEDARLAKQGLETEIERRSFVEDNLRERNYELELLAHSIAHDLRAPLRAINANSTFIAEEFGIQEESFFSYLERIRSNTRRMNDLLDGLAAVLRLGRAADPPRLIVLSSIFQQILLDLGETDARLVHVDIPKELRIEGFGAALYVLFLNLISNGLKFSRAGTRSEVWIKGRSEHEQCVIEVSDNGIGIDAHYVEKIFEPFNRGVTEKEFEGSGIGLTIVQRAIALHRGKINVVSTPGAGTTFKIELPIQAPIRYAVAVTD